MKQLNNSTIINSATATNGNLTVETSSNTGTTSEGNEKEILASLLKLHNRVDELSERIDEMEKNVQKPDNNIEIMATSITRLSQLSFVLQIIVPFLMVGVVAIASWLINPNSLFMKIAIFIVGLIGIGALLDVIMLPRKFSNLERELEKIKNKIDK